MVAAGRQNVYAAFAARFPADPARVFIENADGRSIAYGHVASRTAQLAQALAAAGLGKGARIAVQVDKSPEAILLYLATARLGAVYVPVHIDLTPAEVDWILLDADPCIVVCRPDLAARLQPWRAARADRRVFTLDAAGQGSLAAEAAGRAGAAPIVEGGGLDPNAIVYTSGTTGRPKGAVMTNGLVIWNALALAARWAMTGDDCLLHANPMAFTLFGAVTPVLAAGARLRLLQRFQAADVIAALPGATLFAGVPTHYARLLAHTGFDRACCCTIRLFITGSAPMRSDLFDAFEARSGHRLLDRYGSTEALLIASMPAEEPRRAGVSGLPLAGCSVRLVDDAGLAVAPGDVGAIELRQPCMFGGYWNAPEKTKAAFRPGGWFATGDFGRLAQDGAICVLGRGVDLIISGGLNIYPIEVETQVNAVDNVAESAVIGVPHPDFGEAVVAVVQLADPVRGFAAEAALAQMGRSLARYKLPKHVHIVADLPRNTLGKVQKALLKAQLQHLFADPEPAAAHGVGGAQAAPIGRHDGGP